MGSTLNNDSLTFSNNSSITCDSQCNIKFDTTTTTKRISLVNPFTIDYSPPTNTNDFALEIVSEVNGALSESTIKLYSQDSATNANISMFDTTKRFTVEYDHSNNETKLEAITGNITLQSSTNSINITSSGNIDLTNVGGTYRIPQTNQTSDKQRFGVVSLGTPVELGYRQKDYIGLIKSSSQSLNTNSIITFQTVVYSNGITADSNGKITLNTNKVYVMTYSGANDFSTSIARFRLVNDNGSVISQNSAGELCIRGRTNNGAFGFQSKTWIIYDTTGLTGNELNIRLQCEERIGSQSYIANSASFIVYEL